MFVFVKKADIYGIIEYCWKATVGMFLILPASMAALKNDEAGVPDWL